MLVHWIWLLQSYYDSTAEKKKNWYLKSTKIFISATTSPTRPTNENAKIFPCGALTKICPLEIFKRWDDRSPPLEKLALCVNMAPSIREPSMECLHKSKMEEKAKA